MSHICHMWQRGDLFCKNDWKYNIYTETNIVLNEEIGPSSSKQTIPFSTKYYSLNCKFYFAHNNTCFAEKNILSFCCAKVPYIFQQKST